MTTYPAEELVDIETALAEALKKLDLSGGELVGDGLESCVFRAHSASLGDVAVRVPRYTQYRLPQRKPFTALANLTQEYVICQQLHRAGLPVAQPLLLADDLPIPVLVSRYVPTEQHGADPGQIGELLALVHAVPVPNINLLDHDGGDLVSAMSGRLTRRWQRLHERAPEILAPPPPAEVSRLLTPAGAEPKRLLHLDIRACNILSVGGHIAALVDWSCAMFGHPAAEIVRVDEYAQLPENGLDADRIRAAYGKNAELPAVSPVLDALLRFDAIAMLGSLFYEYIPDQERAAWAVSRAVELAEVVHHGLRGK